MPKPLELKSGEQGKLIIDILLNWVDSWKESDEYQVDTFISNNVCSVEDFILRISEAIS